MNVKIFGLIPLLLVACSTRLATEVQDCERCPAMVDIPGGTFLMGTADADKLMDPRTGKPAKNDSPQHAKTVSAFALGKYEVTVGEYGAFVEATGYTGDGKCLAFGGKDGRPMTADIDWENPGFEQTDDAPVSCVSFFDAQAYANWLSAQTGEDYRLPTEAEWEYAARASTTTHYYWGADETRACNYANIRSTGAIAISQRQADADITDGFPCDDGAPGVSPVGSYQPNDFGLYDMQGNAWEWVADCNHKDYVGAPVDGRAWLDDNPCQFGMIRGGSYLNLVQRSSTAVRVGRPRSGAGTNMGFRVARGGERTSIAATSPAARSAVADNSAGSALFIDNCAACHIESDNFQGLYGTDLASLMNTIRDGGNNVMSMPAFQDVLTDDEIAALAGYVRRVNDWD